MSNRCTLVYQRLFRLDHDRPPFDHLRSDQNPRNLGFRSRGIWLEKATFSFVYYPFLRRTDFVRSHVLARASGRNRNRMRRGEAIPSNGNPFNVIRTEGAAEPWSALCILRQISPAAPGTMSPATQEMKSACSLPIGYSQTWNYPRGFRGLWKKQNIRGGASCVSPESTTFLPLAISPESLFSRQECSRPSRLWFSFWSRYLQPCCPSASSSCQPKWPGQHRNAGEALSRAGR